LLGLLAGLVMLCCGGQVQLVFGVAEFSGGLLGVAAGALPGCVRFSAITLGHVILGLGRAEVSAARAHEHVHVRQYEVWGPLFLLAYAGSSLWQIARGRRFYRDNFFERQAYAAEASAVLWADRTFGASSPSILRPPLRKRALWAKR
jgi:hypothetical protein